MPFDTAVDIDTFDRTKVDFGNDFTPSTTTVAEEPPAEEPPAEEPPAEEPPAEEPPAEEPPAEEPARNAKGQFEPKIPKSRFDEAVGKEREAREAAERRAAELQQQLDQRGSVQQAAEAQKAELDALETKISELETKHAQLLIDGDAEGAAKIMREIRTTEREVIRAENAVTTQTAVARATESDRYNLVVAKLESEFPQMNPDSAEFDEMLVGFVMAERDRLVQGGASPSQATEKAARAVMDRFGKKPEAADPKGLQQPETTAQDRKTAQVKKNLDTAVAQPPSTKQVGLDSDKMGEKSTPEAAAMTLDEFMALPESVKARMRGDTL